MPEIDLIDTSFVPKRSCSQGHERRPFPSPLIVSPCIPSDDPCSWGYAPELSGNKEYPFVLKFPHRQCDEHRRDYYV